MWQRYTCCGFGGSLVSCRISVPQAGHFQGTTRVYARPQQLT